MISKSTLLFLKELKANNNREWFVANKNRYEEAKKDFENFIDLLISKISLFDKSVSNLTAKDCVFRIYRDVRFSKDKSPYKTNFGAYITSKSKKTDVHTNAGYYIHIEEKGSMIGGGAYMPPSDWLNAIRQEIDYNADEFKNIINGKDFKKYFGKIQGDKLVRPPKGYDVNHPEIELLKLKSYLATKEFSDKEICSDDFLQNCTNAFKILYPFNNFLNRAKD